MQVRTMENKCWPVSYRRRVPPRLCWQRQWAAVVPQCCQVSAAAVVVVSAGPCQLLLVLVTRMEMMCPLHATWFFSDLEDYYINKHTLTRAARHHSKVTAHSCNSFVTQLSMWSCAQESSLETTAFTTVDLLRGTVSQASFTILLTLIYSNPVSKLNFSPEHIEANFVSAPGCFRKWCYTNPLIIIIILSRPAQSCGHDNIE